MTWTDERVDLLKRLAAQNLRAQVIADQLGGVTRSAVIGKLHRLGLTASYSPSARLPPPPQRRDVEAAKLRIMRKANTTATASHGIGGLLRRNESRKPVTLARVNLPDPVAD